MCLIPVSLSMQQVLAENWKFKEANQRLMQQVRRLEAALCQANGQNLAVQQELTMQQVENLVVTGRIKEAEERYESALNFMQFRGVADSYHRAMAGASFTPRPNQAVQQSPPRIPEIQFPVQYVQEQPTTSVPQQVTLIPTGGPYFDSGYFGASVACNTTPGTNHWHSTGPPQVAPFNNPSTFSPIQYVTHVWPTQYQTTQAPVMMSPQCMPNSQWNPQVQVESQPGPQWNPQVQASSIGHQPPLQDQVQLSNAESQRKLETSKGFSNPGSSNGSPTPAYYAYSPPVIFDTSDAAPNFDNTTAEFEFGAESLSLTPTTASLFSLMDSP